MSETVEKKNEEFEKIDVFSFVNDFFHRLRRLWLLVLILTVASTGLFY